eukprot:4965019-Pleurochrysis_carterae.AAC.2
MNIFLSHSVLREGRYRRAAACCSPCTAHVSPPLPLSPAPPPAPLLPPPPPPAWRSRAHNTRLRRPPDNLSLSTYTRGSWMRPSTIKLMPCAHLSKAMSSCEDHSCGRQKKVSSNQRRPTRASCQH